MPTTLYPRTLAIVGSMATGAPYTNLVATAVRCDSDSLGTSRGAAASTLIRSTVAGATAGVEMYISSALYPELFISPPLAADVTISGSITFNMRAAESSMSANAAINCRIMRLKGLDATLTEILKTARTTELGTAEAAANWAATPTSTAFVRGDRIVVIPFLGDGGGTMASGYTGTFWYNGAAGATGDSYVTFTETLTFDETAPTGTTVYPTATSAGINPGSATELEAWTSRGGGVTTAITNTVDGPIAPIQITATAGGTAVEWYTKQLQAVTLSGPILLSVRAASNALANAKMRAEVAVTAADGSGATVWGVGGCSTLVIAGEATYAFWVEGDDLAITNGQRVRIRVWIDDGYGLFGHSWMITGYTVTSYYAGAAGATGDTYATFPVTLAEYGGGGGAAEDIFPYVGGGYYG